MTSCIYWFRNDLRLTDNPALLAACERCDRLLLLALVAPDETEATRWGFARWSGHRRTFREQALAGLKAAVARCGGELLIVRGTPAAVLPPLAHALDVAHVFCEAIAAPEEIAEITALRNAGLDVQERWQSTLLDPAQLPFAIDAMPDVFTAFRQSIERSATRAMPPRPKPVLPRRPTGAPHSTWSSGAASLPQSGSSFPFDQPAFHGSEQAALSHLQTYFGSTLPQTYKATRNGLTGIDYSTKFSPWLATGALSPRTVYDALRAHEIAFGANESTYWIWFELLWRDFFRCSSLRYGSQLFRAAGLSRKPPPTHDPRAFKAWVAGQTGQDLVDAGMRELAATGYLSNRLRQVVASYLVHELACDWRAGAAWFESQLIDYDVCSNHGNWLYIAGRGCDPRQGRQFNPAKQAAAYDADGRYRRQWGSLNTL